MRPEDIAKLRKRLGLAQPQFAQLLGVHAITVSRWERGDQRVSPSPYQVALMAEFEKAAASKEAAQIKEALGNLLIGAGIAAALLLLLEAAKKK